MEPDALRSVAAAAISLADRLGLDIDQFVRAAPRLFMSAPTDALPAVAPVLADALDGVTPDAAPDVLGSVYEGRLPGARRRAEGIVYTPRGVADGLLAAAVGGLPSSVVGSWRVLDPACGGGAFLLAAARWLAGLGVPTSEIVGERLWGIDIDPDAVAVAEASLALWAALRGGAAPAAGAAGLVVGDALVDPDPFAGRGPAAFGLVIGNPSFRGQLAARTRHDTARRQALKARWGELVRSYTDPSALFLAAARGLAAPGGRVALVQPISVLGARDARAARRASLVGARLHGLWVAPDKVFGAAVRTCAPVIAVGGTGHEVRRWVGPSVEPRSPVEPDPRLADGEGWAALALDLLGVPMVVIGSDTSRTGPAGLAAVLGDLATATAGFRDQFYGLVPYVREAPRDADPRDLAPLITSGLIDPGTSRWGCRPTRFAGRQWRAPAVDVAALRRGDPALARWLTARLRPKVLLATQTKVLEVVADPLGVLVPSVPVISIEPFDAAHVAPIAAALSSPPISSWAMREAAGAARSADAVKLAARQVVAVPLPSVPRAWEAAAVHFADGDLAAFAPVATEAYGLAPDHPVVSWWLARLPRR